MSSEYCVPVPANDLQIDEENTVTPIRPIHWECGCKKKKRKE